MRDEMVRRRVEMVGMLNALRSRLIAPFRAPDGGGRDLLRRLRRWQPRVLVRVARLLIPPRYCLSKDARLILRSGVFDEEFYLSQYPEVTKRGITAVEHYVSIGALNGLDPHPLFDSSFYLERNPDVAAAGANPLLHYLSYGAGEGRNPHPLFDSSLYLERNPDAAAAGANPLIHYLMTKRPGAQFRWEECLLALPSETGAGATGSLSEDYHEDRSKEDHEGGGQDVWPMLEATISTGFAEPKDAAQQVATVWSDFAKKRAQKTHANRMFAHDHPVIRSYVYDTYLDGSSPFVYVRRFLPGGSSRRALEIGCGGGDLSIAAVQTGLCESIDAFDLAAGAIEVARRKAHEAGVTTINFFIEDANKLRLPPETYDFIFASNALHHIENLENLFEQVNQALTPNGLFFGDDYVGPSRMQWSPLQLTLMNRMLKCLPERYRVNSLMNDQGIKHMIERIPIEIFLEKDPSEGVRAAEILPQLERHLVPVEIKPLGGSLVYDLLLGIIQNFDDNDENDVALLRILCQCEAILIEQGILSSDFAYFAARKRSTAHLSDTPLRARK